LYKYMKNLRMMKKAQSTEKMHYAFLLQRLARLFH